MIGKAELRRLLRSRGGGPAEREAESRRICEHILGSAWYREARVIGGYMPLKWEADITPVLAEALKSGRTLALPLCGHAPQMTLRRVRRMEELVPGAYGILEPPQDAELIPAAEVELLLVPLEGVDPRGLRLGKGGGYYDRLLGSAQLRSMGCALSWQWVERVPSDGWDQPLAACCDQEKIHYFDCQA